MLRFNQYIPSQRAAIAAQPFVGSEEEQLLPDDGPAEAASELPVFLVHTFWTLRRFDLEFGRTAGLAFDLIDGHIGGTVELVVGIQALVIDLDHGASMERVSAVGGDHFDLGAGIAAILRRIRIGLDAHFLHRFLVRGNDGCASRSKTVHANAIHLVIIGGDSLPVGYHLHLVLDLKDLVVRTSRADLAGKIGRIP